jgi:hypothetical protein
MRPSMASPIYLYACSQRVLGVAPPPPGLALAETRATHTPRDSNLDSGNQEHMSGLSTPAYAYLNDAPIYGLTNIPLRRPTANGYWVVPWPSHPEQTPDTTTLATKTPSRPPNYGYMHLTPSAQKGPKKNGDIFLLLLS